MTFEHAGWGEQRAERSSFESAAADILQEERGELERKLKEEEDTEATGKLYQAMGIGGTAGLAVLRFALDLPLEQSPATLVATTSPVIFNLVYGTALRAMAGSAREKLVAKLDRIKAAFTKKG